MLKSLSNAVTVGALALLALGVAGCEPPRSNGTASGSRESGESTTTTSAEAVAIDPCQTLKPADSARLGLEGAGLAKRIAGAPVCDFKVSAGGIMSVVAHNDKAVDELNLTDGQVEATSVGSVAAKLIREALGPGGCAVVFPSSPRTSIQINVSLPRDTETACQAAQQAASLVAANLRNN
ncbi:DUF3558 family protein [Saccharopolyspora phatthalungensis]|uniref:DUF3558 domain-containing protein n=1 Tax=Saccharopolyspora phatthalungensis TaxID=664693 RepID=A0A840Q4U3_9PSEU|nr:DUF3558 family protein [Saccharopolyspora phatthalungensis]MBB5155584.1 hypothetical protein [Saccharopolyspora phatthalungensis]